MSTELRYEAETDSILVITNGRVVKQFTCAYRGQVKAAIVALDWLGAARADVKLNLGFEFPAKQQ